MTLKEMKLTLAKQGITIKSEAKNEGWIIKIKRHDKTIILNKVYKDKKLLDRAILNAICYELKKL